MRAHCPLALHPRRTPSPRTPGSRLSSPHKLALRAAEAASPAPRIIYSYTRQALGLGSGRYLPSPRPHRDDQEGDAGGDPSSPPAAPVPGPHWFPRPSLARLGREPGPAPALGATSPRASAERAGACPRAYEGGRGSASVPGRGPGPRRGRAGRRKSRARPQRTGRAQTAAGGCAPGRPRPRPRLPRGVPAH